MKKQTLRLFKALPIKTKRKKTISSLIEKTIQYGFIFSPEVMYNYSEGELNILIEIITQDLGLTPQQMNSSFHKSWKKIKEASIEQLVLEQLIHYITTYGFEAMGIYNENSVYIPAEKLIIPKIEYNTILKKTGVDKFIFTVINGYTAEELKDKILNILQSGIALSEDTMKDIVTIIEDPEYSIDISLIKNKEVKIRLYDALNIVPSEPVEFLRYMIFKSTGKSLLIKNKTTIEAIKSNYDIYRLFNRYNKENGLDKLAQIFYRFKPLFLAFRNGEVDLNPIINRIRRLADTHHVPMPIDYLNEVTSKIKNLEIIDPVTLKKELNKANIFRKIRLAYALKYRTKNFDAIQYTIRNDKAFSTEFNFGSQAIAKTVLDIVLESIIKDIKVNVEGKKVYIPNYITYTLPATEKRFTGYFPSGTCISIPKDMIFGVHWDNLDNYRVDLDLSLLNMTEGKIGWAGAYRTSNGNILFSGDMTDARKPNGATELFYIQKQVKESYLVQLNYFNFSKRYMDIDKLKQKEVPFRILVGLKAPGQFNRHCLVDPNNVLAISSSKMDQKQKTLGLVTVTTNECKFYFNEAYLGNNITSSIKDYTEYSRKYLINSLTNMITLNDLIIKAGAIKVDDKLECDIDLSPESLEKDTIINLLK